MVFGTDGWNIRASLFQNGSWTGRHLCDNLPATASSCDYTVPDDLAEGDDYQVQVYFMGHGVYQDFSGAFSVAAPTEPFVQILTPAAEDVWEVVTEQAVTWNAHNSENWSIRASLFKNGAWTGQHLCDNLPAAARSCSFAVPQDLTPDDDYQVQVYYMYHGAYQDLSKAFTIAAPASRVW